MRVAALDAHPHRWEQAISATLSAALVLLWLGWHLGRR